MEPGTKVELSLLHVSEPEVEVPAELPARARDWPLLQHILAEHPALRPALSPRLLQPDTLGSVTAFLAAALKLGVPQRAVGEEALEVLRSRGQGELVTRLIAEVQQAGQTFIRSEAPATEWRSLLLPLPPDSAFTRAALHVRREADPENPTTGPLAVKRLVIEVELSRLGPMLLDGAIRPRRFDMTLRSQRRLPRVLRDELRLAYREALITLSWQGGLGFQTAAELWLRG